MFPAASGGRGAGLLDRAWTDRQERVRGPVVSAGTEHHGGINESGAHP